MSPCPNLCCHASPRPTHPRGGPAGGIGAPPVALLAGAVRAAAGEGQRLLEADVVGGRVLARGERGRFELIEPLVVIEEGDERSAAVSAEDAELAAVDLAHPVRNIDFDLSALAHRLDGMIDDRVLRQTTGGQVDHRHLEHAVALRDRVDVRGRRAAVCGLIGRGLDLRFGWKRDGEGIVRIAVFLPGLRKGGAARDERRKDDSQQTHIYSLSQSCEETARV